MAEPRALGGRPALPRLDVLPDDALLGGSYRAAGGAAAGAAAGATAGAIAGARAGAGAGAGVDAAAEHMRVPAHQLVAYRPGHGLEVEMLRLGGNLCVKHHLKQQIAQLVLQMRHVAAFDGIRDFIGLFDGVRRNAREGLLPIPGATIGGAQAHHDGQQFTHPAIGVRDPRHCCFSPCACSMRRSVISMPAVAPQILRSP